MSLKKFNTRQLLVGGLVFCTLIGLLFYFRHCFTVRNQVTLAQVDLAALLKEHPNWEKYAELEAELDKLQEKWGIANPQAGKEQAKANATTFPELRRQVGEIERIYTEESKLKAEDLNKSIQEYIENKTKQLNQLLNDKLQSINSRLTVELQRKTAETETKFQAYVNALQNEYQVTLSNLQLQLSLLDLSTNAASTKAEKEKFQAEISRIQTEIDRRKTAKQKVLQNELQTLIESEKKVAHQEFEQFKAEKESQFKEDIMIYRQKIGNDFSEWYQKRAGELDSAKKLRKDELEKEYRQDRWKETVIRSQQQQLKEEMLWQIRQQTKKVARLKKIDCVVTSALVNVNIPDLTGELTGLIKN